MLTIIVIITIRPTQTVIWYQHKLIKMRTELSNLNTRAVPFLSRAAANLCWYYTIPEVQFDLELYKSFVHQHFTKHVNVIAWKDSCHSHREATLFCILCNVSV